MMDLFESISIKFNILGELLLIFIFYESMLQCLVKTSKYIFVYIYVIHTLYCQKYWHPHLMKGLTTLVISMSTNLNVSAYNDILGNCVLLML